MNAGVAETKAQPAGSAEQVRRKKYIRLRKPDAFAQRDQLGIAFNMSGVRRWLDKRPAHELDTIPASDSSTAGLSCYLLHHSCRVTSQAPCTGRRRALFDERSLAPVEPVTAGKREASAASPRAASSRTGDRARFTPTS